MRAAALAYLARYAATAHQVGQVLERRIRRYGSDVEEPEPVIRARIADIVTRLVDGGLVDDRAYATMKAASLVRRGTSTHHIAATLRKKGVDQDLTGDILAALDQEHGPERERVAALRYAKRRRRGPWSTVQSHPHPQRRNRDIAAMVRAGFSSSIAIWVVDLDPSLAAEILDRS